MGLTLRVGDLRLRGSPQEVDFCAWHSRAGGILDRDVDASGKDLSARRHRQCEREHQCRCECGRSVPTHHEQGSLSPVHDSPGGARATGCQFRADAFLRSSFSCGLTRNPDFSAALISPFGLGVALGQHVDDGEVVVGFAELRIDLDRGAVLALCVGHRVAAEVGAAEREREPGRHRFRSAVHRAHLRRLHRRDLVPQGRQIVARRRTARRVSGLAIDRLLILELLDVVVDPPLLRNLVAGVDHGVGLKHLAALGERHDRQTKALGRHVDLTEAVRRQFERRIERRGLLEFLLRDRRSARCASRPGRDGSAAAPPCDRDRRWLVRAPAATRTAAAAATVSAQTMSSVLHGVLPSECRNSRTFG